MKTVEEIYQEMRAAFADATGLEAAEGCDLAARLYAVAAQVYGLYVQADWVARQAFPQTAGGEYLDLHAQMRGLTRKQATKAEGSVTFTAGETAQEGRAIPAGTVCMTAGLIRFETKADAVLPAGALTVSVDVRAVEAGAAGNVAAGAVVAMAVAPVGIVSCTNAAAFTGGAGGEDDETLRARVLDTFKRLPNGANAAFYEQGALSFDEVAAATVLPRNRGVGTVDVVAATLSGVPDQTLLDTLADYFEQRREIAVDVEVLAPTTVTVNLTVSVKAAANATFAAAQEQVTQALTGWFNGKRLGKDVLLAELGSLIYGCPAVDNYAIAAPATDTAITKNQLPVLGTLTVEELT